MLCDGVQIEAYSVEDKGKGISFNVFCYNVQPGVIIDYSDGSNKLDRSYKADQSKAVEQTDKSDKKGASDNGSQNGKTTFTLEEFATNGSGDNTENVSRAASEKTYSYIGNRNSHVFHYPDCDSVKDMKEKNKVYFEDVTREVVIGQGFKACHRCNP